MYVRLGLYLLGDGQLHFSVCDKLPILINLFSYICIIHSERTKQATSRIAQGFGREAETKEENFEKQRICTKLQNEKSPPKKLARRKDPHFAEGSPSLDPGTRHVEI